MILFTTPALDRMARCVGTSQGPVGEQDCRSTGTAGHGGHSPPVKVNALMGIDLGQWWRPRSAGPTRRKSQALLLICPSWISLAT